MMQRVPKLPDLPVHTGSRAYSDGPVFPPPVQGHARTISVGSSLSQSSMTRLIAPQVPAAPQTSVASDMSASAAFDSVVKVLVTYRDPDYANPWQSMTVASSIGSGVAIQTQQSCLHILTAAHVVMNQTFLQVERTGVEDPEKYVASVYAICHDCDLALLSVDNEHFWKDLKPITLGPNPPLRSIVLVAGFPVGGQELSVTEGVVSRIESHRYSHSGRELLAADVDAAINPGNSGGPAFSDQGQLIGIAFQSMTGANAGGLFQINIQTVGHIILPTVIQKFLDGLATFGPEAYLGFPSSGIKFQELTNPQLRKLFKLQDTVSGVLITEVWYGTTCHGVLQKNDILTHVADKPVANNGTIALDRRYGRTSLYVEFNMHQCGDVIPLRIIRQGKAQTVEATARPLSALAKKEFDKRPRYFIWCGVVFQPLTLDYLQAQEQPSNYLIHLASQSPSENEREIVVMSRTLSDSVNVGYETLAQRRIRSVNGEKIKDLNDFVDKVEKSVEQPLLEIETWQGEVVILPGPSHPDAAAATERILKQYRVADDRYLE